MKRIRSLPSGAGPSIGAVGGEDLRLAAGGVDREQGFLAEVVGGRVERLAVGGPGDPGRRAVVVLPGPGAERVRAVLARREVAQDDFVPVGLVARAGHREVREGLAVGREAGRGVPGGVRRDPLRSGRAVGRDLPEVEVRRPGLFATDVLAGEDELLRVGGDGDLVEAAERLRRRVGVHLGHQVLRGSGRLPVRAERKDEDVVPAAVLPGVPVADEEAVEEHPARLHRFLRLESLLRLGRALPGEDLHREDEELSAGSDLEVVDVERLGGDLLGLAAGEREVPDLLRASARGEEEEALPVGGPAGVRVSRLVRRQAANRLRPHVEEPEVGPPPVRGEVRRPEDERDLRPVGGDLGVGDPVHGEHVVDGEGMGLGGRAREGDGEHRDEEERGAQAAEHGPIVARDGGLRRTVWRPVPHEALPPH